MPCSSWYQGTGDELNTSRVLKKPSDATLSLEASLLGKSSFFLLISFSNTVKPHNWPFLVARETGSVLHRNTLWDWMGSLIGYCEVAQDSGSKLVRSLNSSKMVPWCNSTKHRPSLPRNLTMANKSTHGNKTKLLWPYIYGPNEGLDFFLFYNLVNTSTLSVRPFTAPLIGNLR